MADIENLEGNEVLDFDDDMLPELPEENPLFETGSKRSWFLAALGIAVVVAVMAVVIGLFMGGGSDAPEDIDLPVEGSAGTAAIAVPDMPSDFVGGADKLVAVDGKPSGIPERIVENRKDVTFDPDKPVVERPRPRPVQRARVAAKPAAAPKPVSAAKKAPAITAGGWSVQVGSYNTRPAAEAGERRLVSVHNSLFGGRDFTILSAVLPNGKTTYRLRVVGFTSSTDATGFCRNAQSDGVSCYVTK